MINKIQTTNIIGNNKSSIFNAQKVLNPSFCSNEINNQADSFESKNTQDNNPKTKSELALIALTGATTTFAGIAHHRLGTIIKSVGETAPMTPWGRLQKVFDLTSKDAMTGLYNKGALLTSVKTEYANAIKEGKNFSVAMFDMDNFKSINEVFNHDIGDTVLKQIAKNINDIAKNNGAKGFRYGGEEFVVTLPGQEAEAMAKIAAEIKEAIKNDTVIQGYLPEFKEKASAKTKFVDSQLAQFDLIFPRLRSHSRSQSSQSTAKSIITVLEAHIQECKPSDTANLHEIIKTLKNASGHDLEKLLSVHTKIGDNSTLGKELDKIHFQYGSLKNDLQKWTTHLIQHDNKFTISGGIVNLKGIATIKNSETPIKIADAALKSAKENGKNTIITANEDLIKKTIEEVENKS